MRCISILVTILLLQMIVFTVNATEDFDTSAVILNAKIISLTSSSHSPLYKNLSEMQKDINVTSWQFLKQKGFNDVVFFKVKVRFRYELERRVFSLTLNDEERLKIGMALDPSDFDSLQKDRLKKVYNITDTTPNDYLESLLPKSEDYNYFDTVHNLLGVEDCYFLYITKEYFTGNRLFFIKEIPVNETINNLNILKKHLRKNNLLEDQINEILSDNKLSNRKSLLKLMIDKLYIEDMDENEIIRLID